MRIIGFDTSTEWCSVAIGDGAHWLQRDERVAQTHSERLLPMVDAVLAEAGWRLAEIEGIAFGAGPGSFTGVRIACGVAQGLALGLDCPVMPVSTLAAIAQEAAREHSVTSLLVCTDARMGQVYTAAHRFAAGVWKEALPPAVLSPEAVVLPPEPGPWTGAGSGFAAFPDLAARLGLQRTLPLLRAAGRSVGELAWPKFIAGEGLDAQHALPVYVRNRVALTIAERAAGLRL